MKKQNDTAPNSKPSSGVNAFPLNPYIAGNPVTDPKGFFGREDVFREVKRMLRNPHDNAIVLYGQRRIGKTSVLLQLECRLVEEGEYTPVYFDLQDKAARTLNEVLYELAKIIAPITGQATPEQDSFDDNGNYFLKVFLPEAADKSAKGGLVLLFDEFDVLERPQEIPGNQAGQTFFPYLRSCMVELQRVKFYFVIGRRPEDLSQDASSFFKGARSSRISTLNKKDSENVVRQSERDGSLFWSDAAIEKVWDWTQGHTYMTQLLCSVVWERAYDQEPMSASRVKPADVDAAIDEALKQGQNAFHWIWDGLPPAERVVMAAMAEAGDTIITQEKFREILNRSGVRLILSELELAPETLVKWELLREAEGGYCFAVALLRSWVAANRPLRRVKDEMDRIDKRADMLFRTAEIFHSSGNVAEAENLLRKALESNRNHLKAMLLLGNILFESERINEAVDVFHQAYDYDQTAAQGYLIKALLVFAELQTIESEQLTTYERVLKIDPNQRIAQGGRRKIWLARGDADLKQEKFDQAIAAFEEADDKTKVELARKSKHVYEFKIHSDTLALHKKNKDWIATIEMLKVLISDFSDQGDFRKELEFAESQASLGQRYNDALEALEQGDKEKARVLLVGIISQEPDFMETPRHLLRALYGNDVDIAKVKQYNNILKTRGLEEPLTTKPGLYERIFKLPNKESAPEVIKKAEDEPLQEIVETEKPPEEKEPSRRKTVTDSFLKFVHNLNFLKQKLISSERWKNITSLEQRQKLTNAMQLQKLFKHPGSWLVSILLWLPLLGWALWYWLNSTVKVAVKTNFWLFVIFLIAWILTALFGHLGKFSQQEKLFAFQGQTIRIPIWIMILVAPILIVIISIIFARGIPILLLIVLLGVVMAMIIAWKRAGVVALIIASVVAISVALSVRSTMDANARKFGLTPYIKSKNAVAQVFIKNTLAGTEISELIALSDSLHSSLLRDRNSEAAEYAHALSDCDSLNLLFANERSPKIFHKDSLVKVIQQLSNKDDHVSFEMATLLRRIPDSNLLKLIYQTYNSIKSETTKRLCLYILDGLATNLGVDAANDILEFVESKPLLPEIADARAVILSKLKKMGAKIKTPIPVPPEPDPIVPTPPSILSMKTLSENLSRFINRQNRPGRADSVFKYASLIISRKDSLKHLRTLPWYTNIYKNTLFPKLVPYVENDSKGEIVINFLCGLGDERSLSIVYQKYQASNNSNIKVRYLTVVECFANNPDAGKKDEIKKWLEEKIQRYAGDQAVDDVLKRIAEVVGAELKQPLPNIEAIADSLRDAVGKKQLDKIGDYAQKLIGDDYAKDFSKLQEQNSYDISFFKNAVSLFQIETGATVTNLAEFLAKLGDPRIPDILYEEFHKTDKTNPKLLCLKVLEGFTKADLTIRRGGKTWLGVMRHFEKSPDVDKKMKTTYAMFRPVRTPQKVWVSNIKLNIESGKISIGLADSLMGLAEMDTLRLLKSDDIFSKKFYEKALEFLKNKNEYISRSMALFLSNLQTKNEDLRKQITDKFWKANSDANVRRLCLVILAGVAQNSDQKDDVIKWLEKNQSQEPKEAIAQILSNIKAGRN